MILVFLKAPRPGSVKTRLAAELGADRACAIYRVLAESQLARLPEDCPAEIHFTPSEGEAEMRHWLGQGASFYPQCDGDLGRRLAHAVAGAFSRGARHVFCIGGDCPALARKHFIEAENHLEAGADLVFGPSEDGGYTLLALSGPHPKLFEGIPWSEADTLKASLARAGELGLSTQMIETLYDVDTARDFKRAVADGLYPHS